MASQLSPFVEANYGWPFGSSGWNDEMDQNLVKFSYLHDRNIDAIVSSLPAISNGSAYFNTTDNRLYFDVNGQRYSSVTPKWFEVTLRSTGQIYQFDGSALNLTQRVSDLAADLANTSDPTKNSTLVGFKQTGTGAVGQTVRTKLLEFVSVRDFGAVGDGVVDDTAAIQAALSTSALHVHFPAGTYRVSDPLQDGTPALVSNQANRRITCDGSITATSIVLRVIGIYGSDSYVQLNIDGNLFIAEGIRVYVSGCEVDGCRIKNLYTTTFSAVAIATEKVNGGVIVRNNIIKNLNSVGNGSLGDGNGMSRAVTLWLDTNATSISIVENNVIEDILGEEGDAIAVIAIDLAGVFYDARTIIRGNTIKNFTRRAVKIQAYRCMVDDNYITHTFASTAEIPNRLTVIDFVQGGNNSATGNTLDGCKWFGQFSVFAISPESFDNIFIEKNKVLGLGSETTQAIISVQSRGKNVFITGNTLFCGTGRAISAGDIEGLLVEDNRIFCADNVSERVISLASTVTKGILKGNILLAGSRQCFVGNDALNTVVVDNHSKTVTPMFRNSGSNSNSLIAGNSADGGVIFTAAGTLTGNRLAGNYCFQNLDGNAPGPLYTTNASGPTVAFAGLLVNIGQIVFDTSPTAGNFIGWVATTSGDAATVTWKQFGAIQA